MELEQNRCDIRMKPEAPPCPLCKKYGQQHCALTSQHLSNHVRCWVSSYIGLNRPQQSNLDSLLCLWKQSPCGQADCSFVSQHVHQTLRFHPALPFTALGVDCQQAYNHQLKDFFTLVFLCLILWNAPLGLLWNGRWGRGGGGEREGKKEGERRERFQHHGQQCSI